MFLHKSKNIKEVKNFVETMGVPKINNANCVESITLYLGVKLVNCI